MFLRKKQRQIDTQILQEKFGYENLEDSIIDVKIESKEQLYSSYSYSEDKLNTEFCDFIFEKAKMAPVNEDLTIKIHTNKIIEEETFEKNLKCHFRKEYIEAKKEIKKISTISLFMILFGIIFLAFMVLVNHFFNNFYLTTITEIASWVFIWEAVDYFFLQKPATKAKCLLIQRIYTAKIEILKKD